MPGQSGRAMRFEGTDAHVALPRVREWDTLNEWSYTLSAWFLPKQSPPDDRNHYAVLVKPGWHEGIFLASDHRFAFVHFRQQGNVEVGAKSAPGAADERWHHVSAVLDADDSSISIYVDGKHAQRQALPAGTRPRPFEDKPWRIGIADPDPKDPNHRCAARGDIDDVRIYHRALTPDEISALFNFGEK